MITTILKRSQGKFNTDLRWNLLGFAITAGAGLLINILIAKFLGFEVLGFFNITLALFSVVCQISSFGVHLSIQRYIPQFSTNRILSRALLNSGLVLNLLFSLIVILILLPLSKIPGLLINNELLVHGFIYSFGGIIFMTLNKGILAFLNGMRFMKTYALFNTLRLVFMLIFLILFLWISAEVVYLPLIFAIPELLLFTLLLIRVKKWLSLKRNFSIRYFKLHLAYGRRAALGNILITLNPKVDLLILGIFVAESLVGVYSFTLFISEGFTQLFYVIRNNINPIITKIYYKDNIDLLRKLIGSWRVSFFKIFLLLGLLSAIVYPVFLWTIKVQDYYWENLVSFYGLLTGIMISSGYMIFQFIFNQTGRAGEQTRFFLFLFVITVLLNVILVPFVGIYGAVISFILINIFQVLYLKWDLNYGLIKNHK